MMGFAEDMCKILDIMGPATEALMMLSGKCWRCGYCGLLQPWAHEVCGDEDEDWGGCGRQRDETATVIEYRDSEMIKERLDAWREGLRNVATEVAREISDETRQAD